MWNGCPMGLLPAGELASMVAGEGAISEFEILGETEIGIVRKKASHFAFATETFGMTSPPAKARMG